MYKINLGLWFFLIFLGPKLGTILENKLYWKSMLRKYVIKKSWPPFFELFSEKNMVQIWLILYHREMILRIRIALCLTLKIKKIERPIILLYTPSWSWGQPYSFLNSAKLSWKSEVTLLTRVLTAHIISWNREFQVFC